MRAKQAPRRRNPVRAHPASVRWQDRISVDPTVCHGQACIKGTRVMVSVVVDNLAAGETPEAIAAGYHLQLQDIVAALQYAAELTRDQVLPLAVGNE